MRDSQGKEEKIHITTSEEKEKISDVKKNKGTKITKTKVVEPKVAEAKTNGTCTEKAILQNLLDAGCCAKTICEFKKCMKSEQIYEEIMLLKKHRQKLLDKLHAEQKRIDCLDYLIYKLKKELKDK